MSFDPSQAQATLFGALSTRATASGGTASRSRIPSASRSPMARLVLGALVLGRQTRRRTAREERVGILLPNVNGLAVALFGLNAFGRVAAMLNFTAGIKNLRAACELAEIRTIVTSRRFVEQGKLDEVVAAIGEGRRGPLARGGPQGRSRASTRSAASIEAVFARAIHRAQGLRPDDPAVILFTSGLGGRAEGRRAVERQPRRQCAADQGACGRRDHARRHLLQPAADVPFLRPHGRPAHARFSTGSRRCSIRARCITGRCRS